MAFAPDHDLDLDIEVDEDFAPVDVASDEQIAALKLLLFNRFNALLRASGAAADFAMTQAEFDLVYAKILLCLASFGSSERLSQHPDIRFGADDGGNEIHARFRMVELGPMVRNPQVGISTIRRFARHGANYVFSAWTRRPPARMTPWHRTSGIPQEHAAIAFDFASYIDRNLLDSTQRIVVQNAAQYSLRTREALVNEFQFGQPTGQVNPSRVNPF